MGKNRERYESYRRGSYAHGEEGIIIVTSILFLNKSTTEVVYTLLY